MGVHSKVAGQRQQRGVDEGGKGGVYRCNAVDAQRRRTRALTEESPNMTHIWAAVSAVSAAKPVAIMSASTTARKQTSAAGMPARNAMSMRSSGVVVTQSRYRTHKPPSSMTIAR